MHFSAFAPFGMLRFSSRKPVAQVFFESMRQSIGGDENTRSDFAGPMIAHLYATSMALARVQRGIDRVNENRIPHRSEEAIELHERDYRIVVPAGATYDERRSALAVAESLSQGCAIDVVESALSALLGDALIAVRTHTSSEVKVSPSSWALPPASWKLPRVASKWYRLNGPVVDAGAYTLGCVGLTGDTPPIVAGDVITVDPGKLGVQETVTTRASGSNVVATFSLTHEADALVTTAPWPTMTSTARHVLIVVTSAVARSKAWRRKVGTLCKKMLRATDRWSLVEETSTDTLGPFIPGAGIPGVTVLTEIPTTPA